MWSQALITFFLAMLVGGLAAVATFLWTRTQVFKESRQRLAQLDARHKAQLETVMREGREIRARLEKEVQDRTAELEEQYKNQLETITRESRTALVRSEAASRKVTDLESQIMHAEQENDWLRRALDERPYIEKKVYKIITVGIRSTGKTSLTLKWANPLVDLGMIEGTKIERYERTVSKSRQKEVMTEHVFEVGDWGGEHIVDAQQELVTEEIHGLLFVVDLGGKNAARVDPERIEEQLRQFQPQALQFFFGPRTVASCKTVVLFINKSDLLRGTPAEVEAEAKRLYGRLIDDLMKYAPHIEVRVLVGSASYGHSTHHLFAHFVEKILPRSAYDPQLLQRMQDDLAQVPAHVAHDARLLDVIAADPPRCAGDVAGPTAAASGGGGGENRAGALHTVNGSGFSVPRPGTNGASAGVGATLRLSK
jgi:GTPase SAR1 family protein